MSPGMAYFLMAGVSMTVLGRQKRDGEMKRTKVHCLPVVPPPLRGVSMFRVNVGQSDGEMHQE
jgi:hypothetical protein